MSERLAKMIGQKIAAEGMDARLKLALAARRSVQMIDRYSQGKAVPQPEVARILAKECGASDTLAEEISAGVYSDRSKVMKTG